MGNCLWGEQVIALPSHKYGDPEAQLIKAESFTCKGCNHLVKYIVCGEPKMICEKGRKKRNEKCYEETPGKVYCGGGK